MSENIFDGPNWAASSNAKLTQNQIQRWFTTVKDPEYQDQFKNKTPAQQRKEIGRCEIDWDFEPGTAEFVAHNKGEFAVLMGAAPSAPEQSTSAPKQTTPESEETESEVYSLTLSDGSEVEFEYLEAGELSRPNGSGKSFKAKSRMIGRLFVRASGELGADYISVKKVSAFAEMIAAS